MLYLLDSAKEQYISRYVKVDFPDYLMYLDLKEYLCILAIHLQIVLDVF